MSEFSAKDKVIIYTDGACSGNPGPGGWGARIIHPATGAMKDLSGGEAMTTNNRMEITAAISALSALKRPVEAVVFSDSQYLVKAFNDGWLRTWKLNGWKNSKKQPVENQDLWGKLLDAASSHKITWRHVKGHAGIEHNEACDKLARQEIEKLRSGSPTS